MKKRATSKKTSLLGETLHPLFSINFEERARLLCVSLTATFGSSVIWSSNSEQLTCLRHFWLSPKTNNQMEVWSSRECSGEHMTEVAMHGHAGRGLRGATEWKDNL